MGLGAALGVGGGLSALGGLMSGIGQHQQGGAMASAGRQARKDAERLGSQLSSENQFTTNRLSGLADQSQQMTADRVGNYAGYGGQLAAMRPQAAQTTQGAADELSGMLRRPANVQNVGAGLGTQLAARRTMASRAAPRQTLRNLQLAQQMVQPQQQQGQLDFRTGMAGLGRQGQELQADNRYRRVGIRGEDALRQQQTGYAMDDARIAGSGLSALGQFAGSMAPGFAAGLSDNKFWTGGYNNAFNPGRQMVSDEMTGAFNRPGGMNSYGFSEIF